MKLLLDTHTFLWFAMGDPRLSKSARDAIENQGNEKYISAASIWEIAIKASIGKLQLGEPFDVLVPREITENGFYYQPIEFAHSAAVVTLPFHHRDPFDRMLVAQAMREAMTMVSADATLDLYGVRRIW